MSSVAIFENDLIGLDRTNTINAYYTRDISMNINNTKQITDCCKKLGYFCINEEDEEKAYIKSKIIEYVKLNIYTDTIKANLSDVVSGIREGVDYEKFKNWLSERIQRSNELCVYKNDTDTHNFYSSLTLEELIYLGY